MDDIANFWTWFAEHHWQVADEYDAGNVDWLTDHLTPRVRAIDPRLNWELGPYHDPARTLVVSPSVRDNLVLARTVVSAAPAIAGWHFLPAKPPKVLNLLVASLEGITPEVCADGWAYRLTAYNRREFFDIEVFTDVTAGVSDRDLRNLTHRLIESMLGEVIYLERIAAVTVHRADAPRPPQATPFCRLARHLDALPKQ